MALRAARASDGTISIESAGDRGAIVTISLPLAAAATPEAANA
jgi:signal transduction histidine kinase